MKSLLLSLIMLLFSELSAQPQTPDWAANAVIYEVNIRQYTPEGTFASFQKHLPRLKELGVNILWLMPINPIGEKNRKGTLGSYYSVRDYKEINPEFGDKNTFKTLVDEIHKQGMFVIVDWVANHTAWDHPWVESHPDYYTKDSLGNFVPPVPDWADVIDLNYNNKELRNSMIDALCYWVREFNIDGYRCDVAGMVPTDFWNDARDELHKIKPVFMLAEWETADLHKKAFEMTYAWEIYRLMNKIYKGESTASDLQKQISNDQEKFPSYAYRMQFTSNHDENTWNGTEFDRLGKATEMFAVLTYIIPGMPLIYSGQEAGSNNRLEFFEKDLIDWKPDKFSEFYRELNKLKRENKALSVNDNKGKLDFIGSQKNINVLSIFRSYKKDKVMAFFNMSSHENEIILNDKKIRGTYIDFNNKEKTEISNKFTLTLEPWSYKLYYVTE